MQRVRGVQGMQRVRGVQGVQGVQGVFQRGSGRRVLRLCLRTLNSLDTKCDVGRRETKAAIAHHLRGRRAHTVHTRLPGLPTGSWSNSAGSVGGMATKHPNQPSHRPHRGQAMPPHVRSVHLQVPGRHLRNGFPRQAALQGTGHLQGHRHDDEVGKQLAPVHLKRPGGGGEGEGEGEGDIVTTQQRHIRPPSTAPTELGESSTAPYRTRHTPSIAPTELTTRMHNNK
jgi:hypothetical protein